MYRITMSAAAMLLAFAPFAASAAPQVAAGGGIVTSLTQGGGAATTAATYAGAGNGLLGAVTGGIGNTFDAFGFYNKGLAGLAVSRQTELLSGNVYRFFDTFTNTSGARIQTTVNFFGNLGSDGDELVQTPAAGVMVSCRGDADTLSFCDSDAVIALVSGNNGLGQAAITPDRYNVAFTLDVAAGQSVSLLNFAYLAMEQGGPTDADVTRAVTTGQSLATAPRLEGLTNAQVARIANFTSAVPEPSSWALMLAGFGMIAASRRYRRRSVRAVIA